MASGSTALWCAAYGSMTFCCASYGSISAGGGRLPYAGVAVQRNGTWRVPHGARRRMYGYGKVVVLLCGVWVEQQIRGGMLLLPGAGRGLGGGRRKRRSKRALLRMGGVLWVAGRGGKRRGEGLWAMDLARSWRVLRLRGYVFGRVSLLAWFMTCGECCWCSCGAMVRLGAWPGGAGVAGAGGAWAGGALGGAGCEGQRTPRRGAGWKGLLRIASCALRSASAGRGSGGRGSHSREVGDPGRGRRRLAGIYISSFASS